MQNMDVYRKLMNQGLKEKRLLENKGVDGRVRCLCDILDCCDYRMIKDLKKTYQLIPTKDIAGIVGKSRKEAYSRSLYPISPPREGDNFPAAWMVAYDNIDELMERKNGVNSYEFMGKFYILNGIKIASAAKVADKMVVMSNVVSLQPERSYQELYSEFPDFFTEHNEGSMMEKAKAYLQDRMYSLRFRRLRN